MWNTTLVRLFGVLLAAALIAAACGSTETATAAEANGTATEVAEGDAIEDAAMEDMADMEDTDHDDADHDDADHDNGEHDNGEHGGGEHGDGEHGEGEADGHSQAHGDELLEVDAALPIPGLAIDITETSVPGTFALAVALENFTITPENIDADPIDNEGHLHLYLDGERVTRFTDLEIEVDVPDGEHLVEVELSANNHSAYSLDGEPIRAGVTVTGSGDTPEPEPTPEASEADAVLTATFANGSVELDGPDRLEASQGDVVMIMISSDAADEVHVHGYDIFADVSPDTDAMILFTADIQGRFEIEFEQSGQFIAELVIS